ncbi:MAG: hypothetical protein ACKOPM_14400 [Novosphingobium sp.]
MALKSGKSARQLAILGAVLVLLGLLTGFLSGQMANPRMGLASHLEGLMNGTLLFALAAIWPLVQLPPRAEGWTVGLLGFGSLANWLATFLAALWGAGAETMPLTAAAHRAAAWQESLVTALLITLSFAMVAAIAMVLYGLIKGRRSAG